MGHPLEIEEYLRPPVIDEMQAAILSAGGNEVFFLGKTDDALLVKSVEVLARGDGESVPAVVRKTALGDVVLHNHPSGLLTPSRADLAVASELGNLGAGFYIVDNAVEEIYPVVHPAAREERVPLDPDRLAAYILPGGPVSDALPDYERREEQCGMMRKVAAAFNEDRIALIEAGTGTGKSLAYLIPAIAWGLANKERVLISTNTINLQEQLMGKDLPLLQRLRGLGCTAVLVKGRGNYLCLRKLAAAREEGRTLLAPEGKDEIEELARWAEATGDGSLADLSCIPRREVWERVCAEADQCTRLHCAHYEECFFYRARREASAANLLVANHHLLMADLAVRSRMESDERPAVLPRFHRVILDEAQHLEDVATEYLGFRISKFGLLKILRRLRSARESGRGLLPFICAKLQAAEGEGGEALALLMESVLPECRAIEEKVETSLDRLAAELRARGARQEGADGRSLRITPEVRAEPFWNDILCPLLRELAGALQPFSARLGECLKLLGRLPDRLRRQLESPCVEIGSLRMRLEHHLECMAFLMRDDPEHCRWLELAGRGRGERISFCAAPVDVSRGMRESIYQRFGTVVMTSATLTVAGSFDYFRGRVGLAEAPEGRVECSVFPSPFDYRAQAFVAAPAGLAEPDSPQYEDMLERAVGEATAISRGGAFVLFTSYRLLERMHRKLEGRLAEAGLTVLRQGAENRTLILNRFRRERGAVLFATDSFWEGVDVKGEALQCVILTRLPFRVPTEPVQEARVEAIEARGGDPFMEYSVPQAVIKFRQGFGRLIRHRSDTGAVIILDSRVHTRRYGRLFLRSLPDASLCRRNLEGAFAEMASFFANMRRGKAPGRPASKAGKRAAHAPRSAGGQRRSGRNEPPR